MNLKEAMELKVQRVQGIKDIVYSRIKENVLYGCRWSPTKY